MRQPIVLHLAASAALLSGIACSAVHPQIHADFLDDLNRGTTVTVFPTIVREGERVVHDDAASERVAEYLRDAGLVTRVSHARIGVGVWRADEAGMARESAARLAAHVAEFGLGTRYALVPEFLLGSQGAVVAVHTYVVRQDREVAAILIVNSHSPLFQTAHPSSRAQCTELVTAAMDNYWVNQ